ncbi:MAG TPA: hypothetical protein VI968_02750 [archaeon]|nr:hypothetical protein [archaeon]
MISYKKLVYGLLEEHAIETCKFDVLLGALSSADYIDTKSIGLKYVDECTSLVLTARYTGSMQIGKAYQEPTGTKKRCTDPRIKSNVKRIYRDISAKTGIKFKRVYPDFDENECRGDAMIGKDESTYLTLVLTGE